MIIVNTGMLIFAIAAFGSLLWAIKIIRDIFMNKP